MQAAKSLLRDATNRVVAGLDRRSVVLSEEEKRRVAYHEAGHAWASWVLKRASTLTRSRSSLAESLRLTWQLPTEDRYITIRSQLIVHPALGPDRSMKQGGGGCSFRIDTAVQSDVVEWAVVNVLIDDVAAPRGPSLRKALHAIESWPHQQRRWRPTG